MKRMPEPMAPVAYEIRRRRQETSDVFTVELVPKTGSPVPQFLPGQFNMLYGFGLGEVPISMSGDPSDAGRLVHTIRGVGAVTEGLSRLKLRDFVGVRGPFGSHWPVETAEGQDVVVAAGGLGMAPLRPAVYALLANSKHHGKLSLLYGARTPEDILFPKELARWQKQGRLEVHLAVGQATPEWRGTVGHVTTLFPRASFRPESTVAFVCGPELMMRYTALELEKRGVPKSKIFISMERNMKCAIGFCGHCQFGPEFICLDGPIFPYSRLEHRLRIREL